MWWQFVEERMFEGFPEGYPLGRFVLQHARDQVEQLTLLFTVAGHVPLRKRVKHLKMKIIYYNTEPYRLLIESHDSTTASKAVLFTVKGEGVKLRNKAKTFL